MPVAHEFGGSHTELKLEVLQRYARAYLKVLKNQKFKRIYIDAFAGSGDRRSGRKGADQIALTPGSVRRILHLAQPFDKYYFIDIRRDFVAKLKLLCSSEFPNRNTQCIHGDANEEVRRICNDVDWRRSRALIFIDPYGMQAKWPTLEAIASTKAIDLLLLFPLSGLNRQAALNWEKLDKHKINAINELLGTAEWKEIFYKETPPDLFDNIETERQLDIGELEKYVTKRLNEIFTWVSAAIPIYRENRGPQLFSLFFTISNPSPKAIGLAQRIFKHIQRNLIIRPQH